jgi:hypothetical protein
MGWSPFRKTGLTHYEPAASVKGYTLVTPLQGDASYLIDMQGQVAHRWHYPHVRTFYSQLLPTGNLMVMGSERAVPPPVVEPGSVPPFEIGIRRIGGNATHLWELDWDGNVVWQYYNPTIHHDFVRTADGHTLMPSFTEVPTEIARAVRGGYRDSVKMAPLISDDFIEIDAAGKEVARIHLWELLDPRRDPICPLERRVEWTHTNSVALTKEGNIVFSCRANSRIGMIERSSGKLIWKYGAPDTHHQHHASVLDNGNIQVFDNGMHRIGMPRSAVVEINPKDSKVVWQYTADPDIQFFSAHISGAERLTGGNVLICEGAPGRVFEITKTGDVVWEWVSPFTNRNPAGNLANWLFRAHRFAIDHPALAGKDLDPGRYRELNRMYGL